MARTSTWAALALGLAVFAGGTASAVGPQDQEKKGKVKVLTLTEKDNDTKVKITKGETLVLKLPMQGGTGFTWVVGKADDEKLKAIGKPTAEKPAKPRPGATVIQVFPFEAVTPGSSRLEMWYKRPFEKDKKPAKTFSVTVEIE
jgi:predicted secreted protein